MGTAIHRMKHFVCDRCGDTEAIKMAEEGGVQGSPFDWAHMTVSYTGHTIVATTCPNCLDEFRDWLGHKH